MKLKSPFLIKPHTKVKLDSRPTGPTDAAGSDKEEKKALHRHSHQLAELQEVFYASQTHAVLIVLQGMDTAGKDGTIRHIFSGVNPQGCQVASFKVPTPLEARHEFLWRCQKETPARGMIGIFNRSHYEDVLSPVVHGRMDDETARRHMNDINAWESSLVDAGTVILKFFLHISHEEQTRRLQERLDDPDKHWKLSPADFAERAFWPAYQSAYESILRHTSQKHAPWFCIPADSKRFRNAVISEVLVEAMKGLKLTFPKPDLEVSTATLENSLRPKRKRSRAAAGEKDSPAAAASEVTAGEHD